MGFWTAYMGIEGGGPVVYIAMYPGDTSVTRTGPGDAAVSRAGPGETTISRTGPGDAAVSRRKT